MAAINDAVEALKAKVADLIPYVEAAKADKANLVLENDGLKARVAELEAAANVDAVVSDVNAVTDKLASLIQ